MKYFLRASATACMGLTSLNLTAIQGNLQSSSGYVASSMGGATVAQFSNEFDAVIDNPALMQMTKTAPGAHKFSLGLEYASYPNKFQSTPNAEAKGKLDTAYIPFLGYFYNFSERMKFGTGLFAIGGTGWDYTNSSVAAYKTKGLYAAISVPLAMSYKVTDDFNVGVSLNLVYTQLSSNNFTLKDTKASSMSITPSFGASYALTNTWTLGADFGLGTTSKYKELLYTSATSAHDVKIGTPLQFSLGIGQNTEYYSFGFKYRFVNWKNTEYYKQLNWQDQHTFSLGGQYKAMQDLALRAGIYYVTSVYKDKSGVNGDQTIDFQGVSLPKFNRDFTNAMSFGIPQWQYAIGAGYMMAQKSELNFGFIYEPEASITFSGTKSTGAYEIKKKNSNLQIFFTFNQEV